MSANETPKTKNKRFSFGIYGSKNDDDFGHCETFEELFWEARKRGVIDVYDICTSTFFEIRDTSPKKIKG